MFDSDWINPWWGGSITGLSGPAAVENPGTERGGSQAIWGETLRTPESKSAALNWGEKQRRCKVTFLPSKAGYCGPKLARNDQGWASPFST